MQFETLFAPAREKPVVAALIGCGEFGMSLIAQSRRMEGLAIRAVADRDSERVEASLRAAGFEVDLCEDRAAAEKAFTTDAIAICRSVDDLMALPIEIIVEATGDSEAGARFALAAIEAGRGVAMVIKEAECVAGPILAWKARAKRVPYTLIDGDQPSLLIGLVSWARVLGLPIVAAGKSSEYDYVLDVVGRCFAAAFVACAVAAPSLCAVFAKQLEILKEAVGTLSRVTVLWDADPDLFERTWRPALNDAARHLNLAVTGPHVVSRPEDFEPIFAKIRQDRPDGMLVATTGVIFPHRHRVSKLAVEHALPMMAAFREFPQAGSLLSYGPNIAAIYRRAPTFIEKIIKGTTPGEIPVEQPTKYDLVINLNTAKALNLTIPPTLLARADEVIE